MHTLALLFSLSILWYTTTAILTTHTQHPPTSLNHSSTLNVALVQYQLVGYLTVDQLMTKVKHYVTQASQQGAQVILLPELFTLDLLDYTQPETEQFDDLIESLFPVFTTELQSLVDDLGVYLLAGSAPVKVNGKIRNRSFLFGPYLTPVHQDKLFLTPDEVAWGWEGTDRVTIVEAPWGNTAIVICYDSEFPLISQTLAQQSINLILLPSMTGDPGFTRVRWAAQARAVEHMSYVMVTSTTGAPAPGWEMKSQAAVLGPSLSDFTPLIAEGEMNKDNEIVYATLDMSKLAGAKQTGDYYPALDQKGLTNLVVDVVHFK